MAGVVITSREVELVVVDAMAVAAVVVVVVVESGGPGLGSGGLRAKYNAIPTAIKMQLKSPNQR